MTPAIRDPRLMIDVVAYAWREVNGTPLPRELWKTEHPPLVGDEPQPEPTEPRKRSRTGNGRTWDDRLQAKHRGRKRTKPKPKGRPHKAGPICPTRRAAEIWRDAKRNDSSPAV